jgi:hypothetical protein
MTKKEATTYVANEIIEYRDEHHELHRLQIGEAVPNSMTEADREALLASKSIAVQEEPTEFIQDE